MATHDPSSLLAKLKVLFPDHILEHFARQSGFLQRAGKLDVVLFLWTLLLGWSAGSERSISCLARSYQRVCGSSFSRSGFYRRFVASLLTFMRLLYLFHLRRMPSTSLGPLAGGVGVQGAEVSGAFASDADEEGGGRTYFGVGSAAVFDDVGVAARSAVGKRKATRVQCTAYDEGDARVGRSDTGVDRSEKGRIQAKVYGANAA